MSRIFLHHLHHVSHQYAEIPIIEVRVAEELGQSWQHGADDEGDGGVGGGGGEEEHNDKVATVGQLV